MSYSGSAGGGIGGVSPASTPQAAAVPGTKILLCKSGVKDKKPDPAGAEYGEVFVNYHSGSPMLCFKDNAGGIVEIKPTRNIDGGGGETPPSTGNEIGDTLWDGTHFRVWDGTTWVAIGPNDLAYVQKVDGGTITNSAGSDVDIPVVNNIQAGLMLPADKNKLDTYPANSADLQVDLGYTPAADKGTVTNSNGDDAEIPLATGTNAGLMAPGDKNKIDGYPATPDDLAATLDLQAVTDNGNTTTNRVNVGASGLGDRGFTATNSANTAASVSGYNYQPGGPVFQGYNASVSTTDATISLNANGSATFAGGVSLPRAGFKPNNDSDVFIQAINQTTSKVVCNVFGSGLLQLSNDVVSGAKIELKGADGSASFAGKVISGPADPYAGAANASSLTDGTVVATRENTQSVWVGFNKGNTNATSQIKADGSADFAAGNISLNANGRIDTKRGTNADQAHLQSYSDANCVSLITNGGHYIGTSINTSAPGTTSNISLKADGSAEFAGNVQSGEWDGVSGGKKGAFLNKNGRVDINQTSGTEALIRGRLDGNPTVTVSADGSASFGSGNIFLRNDGTIRGAFGSPYTGGYQMEPHLLTLYTENSPPTPNRILVYNGDTTFYCWLVQPDGTTKLGGDAANLANISLNANGTATFKGAVTAPNVFFNLEPDNEANYTVATSTDEEGNEVETRVYNGPTLDVKEVLLALQQKVNDRDAVIASLTTRIAALEAQAA